MSHKHTAIILTLVLAFTTARINAQIAGPAPRLAIVSDSPEAATAVDVLTAGLSGDNGVQLLERADVERVYREQGLSAQNGDYLKLGQILGADGLLVMESVKAGTNEWLNVRLVAVKPGVVLAVDSFSWPPEDMTEWSSSFAKHLDPLFPKLTVLAKDAVPISVVNLRSAVASSDAAESERQLRLLTVQRLSRERQFFVLERQKMQALGEEKDLNADESTFWDGSYLLEGVVDQNGYSKDTITIDARLTPPKGGEPLLFEVSGSRTNYSEVVNQLAVKVVELLKVNPTVTEWNAQDEAAQYYNEAQWALKWGDSREAQAAADSAWALGKQDLDGAILHVKAYECGLFTLQQVMGNGVWFNAKAGGQSEETIEQEALDEDLTTEQKAGGVQFEWQGNNLLYTFLYVLPDAQKIDQARHMLELYLDYSHTIAPDSVTPDSPWCVTGVGALQAASQVLEHFHAAPKFQAAAEDKLAELRALARNTAAWICRSPAVHDTYWVGDRIATYGELDVLMEKENIFKCEAQYGSLWQERPEDGVALYRELATSPVFAYIHGKIWNRDAGDPRLTAWNPVDQPNIPALWEGFVGELCNSTNVVQQVEGKMIRLKDARTGPELESCFHDVIDTILTNREAITGNNVELLYLNWGLDDLVWDMSDNFQGLDNPTVEKLQQQYRTEFKPQLDAMEREYQEYTTQNDKIEAQKKYLRNFTPYDMSTFFETFDTAEYSKPQAAQLQPLLTAYISNLNFQAVAATGKPLPASDSKLFFLNAQQQKLDAALNPPAATAPPAGTPPRPIVKPPAPIAPIAGTPPATDTNTLLADQFFAIPTNLLQAQFQGEHMREIHVTPPRLREGKLLFDFWCTYSKQSLGGGGDGYTFSYDQDYNGDASLIFNPGTGQWDIITQPGPPQAPFTKDAAGTERVTSRVLNSELFDGALYYSFPGEIRRFDLQTRQWESFPFPGEKQIRLFAVQNRLIGADDEGIFEILDGGKSNHILASTRRQPPVTALDSLDNLGHAAFFAGPDGSLRADVQNKIYTWDGQDWHEDFTLNQSRQPEVFEGGALLRENGPYPVRYVRIWWLATNQMSAALCCDEELQKPPGLPAISWGPPITIPEGPTPAWQATHGIFLANAPAAAAGSNLFFFVEHADVTNTSQGQMVVEKDGRHANLVYLDRQSPKPFVIPLRFDGSRGKIPITLLSPMPGSVKIWTLLTPDALFVGSSTYNPDYVMQMPNTADASGAGFWSIPRSEIDGTLGRLKESSRAEESREAAGDNQRRAALLAKYDQNHNGVIDPDEKEAAIADPDFIASELDKIDVNHHYWLDPDELAYFDANRNKILDPDEQAGIGIAQHLLAAKLFKELDVNGNGQVSRSQFNDWKNTYGPPMGGRHRMFPNLGQIPGRNQDSPVDLSEIESYLKQQTRRSLRNPQVELSAMQAADGAPPDESVIFKLLVESYWRNPGSLMNQSQHSLRPLPPGFVLPPGFPPPPGFAAPHPPGSTQTGQ